MIAGIQEATDRKMADVQALKKSDKPTIMYGAGSYAADVTKFLKSQGITISAYCVDGAYVKPGQKFMDTYPVVAVEEAYQQYPGCNVVIGFADYKRAREVLAKLEDKSNVYFIDAPNQLGFFDYQYIQDHMSEFEETCNWLEDQRSRDIMIAFINAKLSGDPSPLYGFYEPNQYFADPIELTDHETFVDCGAYDGDTIRSIVENTRGQYRKIFAFEPEEANYQRLQKYLQDNNIKNVETYNAGTWSEKTTLRFSSDSNMAAIVADEDGDISIPVETIDDVIGDEEVTFVKMDIEGAELPSLQGAAQTIKRCKPKLTICVYHKPEDLITIPQYIKSLSGDYKFYLRHHQMMSWEMVLYAVPV
jgi:FkbM family methyltransferase